MTKTKSKHHQSENTFKFLTLNERLANIKIDVGRQINRYNTKPEETETYFSIALAKWVDLNYTGLFYEFTLQVKKNCHTLAQLVYFKDKIVDSLIEFLGKANELTLQPLLDLIVQLSRDLQNDFYPYFPRLFNAITKLLETQNTDILEWAYQTLSYLFKFLWRYMLKDLNNVFELYSPLFEESRKEYIRNFSAESFAFLMRKATDKNELFTFLIEKLIEKPDECKGIGRIIFEMFHGVKKQFNMCTEQSFAALLDKINCYSNEDEKNELVFNCINYTVESMADYTNKEHSTIVWNCFYTKLSAWKEDPSKLNYLVQLMITFLNHKDCILVNDLDLLLENINKLSQFDFGSQDIRLQLTKNYLNLCTRIFLSRNIKFSIEKISFLPKLIFQTKYDYELIIETSKHVFQSESCESVILPNLLKYFNELLEKTTKNSNENYEKCVVSLLCEYLIEFKKIVELDTNYTNENESNQFFDLLNKRKNLAQLKRLLEDKSVAVLHSRLIDYFNKTIKESSSNLDKIEICILAPLFQSSQMETLLTNLNKKSIEILIENFKKLNEFNLNENSSFEIECLLFSLSVWSLMHFENNLQNLIDTSMFHDLIELMHKLDELRSRFANEKNVNEFQLEKHFKHLLRALNYCINLNINSSLYERIRSELSQILALIKKELSSPYHENRLHCINILNWYFKPQVSESEEDSLFSILLSAENTPASLDEYRQKLYYLQRLDAEICKKYFTDNQLQEISLRYLFGALFENFKLLWDPLVVLVQSYANNMNANEFWPILSEQLNYLNLSIESKIKLIENDTQTNETTSISAKLAFLRIDADQNIDYPNNRYLLCKSMQGFANSCESKTRILVPNFFRFLNNEYYKFENQLLTNTYEDLTSNLNNDSNKKKKEKFFNKALLNKYLCGYLDIFAKFSSPKSWFQEEKLRDLYLNLLCHQDANVQKSALTCICVYKYSYLLPYKENLENLLEGKNFRRELVLFSLDENAGIIHSDHRADLLPLLMRILYGKFHSHESTHTSSKDTKSNKRSIIIQFLSSCSESELYLFFDFLFGSITKLFEKEESNLSEENEKLNKFLLNLQLKLNDFTSENSIYNLNSVIPLKRLLGILDSLEIIIKKLSRRMENFSHRLLQILCFTHKYAMTLYEIGNGSLKLNKTDSNSKLIGDHHMNLLRIIRQKVTLRFKQFFENFDHLNFTQNEYYFVFETFVWPLAAKLKTESLKSVSNLLKIFSLWSERSIYYPLFVIKPADFDSITNTKETLKSINLKEKNILDILFELIDSDNCSTEVINHVMDSVHNLVTYADFKPEEQMDLDQDDRTVPTKPLPFNLTHLVSQESNELNFGTIILKPYVGSIINHIERIVDANLSKKTLPSRPLKILARISCFASESQSQCERIIQLLIPYLIKNRKESEETEINILNSINHLIKQVRNVDEFIPPLSRLFSIIKNRQSQVELHKIFKTISDLDAKHELIAKLVYDLNSWDPKRLEEPNYLLRLDAFKILNKVVDEWTSFDINLTCILIYNCVYFIHSIEDLAIKESSTNSIKLLLNKASKLELKKSDIHFFETNFNNEIKTGFRSKSENVRHEFIKIFVDFINLFKNVFKSLEQFCSLMDKEDIEKDFFENIKHIQMHRRSRALKKLQRACYQNDLSSENLLHYMMPLVKSFLENETYEKYDYLIDEACISIGAICYVLSWPKYLKIVEFYMKLMHKTIMKPKIVSKILIHVLDAFHFDLTNSSINDHFEADNLEEEITNEKEVNGEEEEVKMRKKQLVSADLATKIHTTVSKSILPVLFKTLTKRSSAEDEHKMNKQDDQDEQILKVPMALAILKLLKNLPLKTFETHLPGLLYKVCDMLKSRSMSVRNTTRECLMKMINSLPNIKYYRYVFKELANSLTRGYQVHVLCFTIHFILKNVQDNLKLGDLDSSLDTLVQTCILEIFSNSVTEEKETKKILAKTFEAKTTSSFNTLEIIAKLISPAYLFNLVKPFKEKLEEFNTSKFLKKVEESLHRIQLGVLTNTGLTNDTLMMFTYGLVNDFLDSSKKNQYNKNNYYKKESLGETSCLIIPSEPKRGGEKPKLVNKTNQHIVAEFSLQLVNHLIKQNRLVVEAKTVQMLEPFLPLLVEYLDGKYPRLTIVSIRCLSGFMNFSLPSFQTFINQITSKLFVLMKTYSNSSLSTQNGSAAGSIGDNFELLMVCYRLISAIIKHCAYYRVTDEQLTLIMHYAERNLYDNAKQASAFNLIKSLLSRKIQSEELTDILSKIMKMSIQAESTNVRLQSRQIILQYMLDYSFGEKKLSKLLEFYVIQLDYEYEEGRESALEMLATIFNTFPQSQLNLYASLFFLPLAIQLHNDTSAKCKKLAHLAIKSLLEKISIEQRDELFVITLALLKDDKKPLHKRIAALLVKIFVEIEGNQFERRLDSVLEIIKNEINYENYVQSMELISSVSVNEKFYDQYLFNILTLLIKIFNECKILNDEKYSQFNNKLYDQIKLYLTHDHLWVRLISCQLFGLLFSNNSIDDLFKNKNSYFNFSTENVYVKIRDLIDSFCDQLKAPVLDNELADQAVKNLAFMARLVNKYPFNESNDLISHEINMEWFIKKVIKIANYELVKTPKETLKRSSIFKLLAAISIELGKESLKNYLGLIITSLQRETLSEQVDENLKKLAQEVQELIKNTVGIEEFSLFYSKSFTKRIENKEGRKRKVAQMAVTDPQLAAMKKIRKMQRKKETKKRKRTSNKLAGTRNSKKAKFENEIDEY